MHATSEPPSGSPNRPPTPVGLYSDPIEAHPMTEIALAKLAALKEFPPKSNESWEVLTALLSDMKQRAKNHLVSDRDLEILTGKCPALNQVNLAGNYLVSDRGLAHMTHFSALRSLNLASTQVHTMGPLISALPVLQEVNLFDTHVEPNSLKQFLRTHTCLRKLTLPEDAPHGIFAETSLDFLQEVSVIIGDSFTFEDFLDLLKRAPNLTSIRVQIRHPVSVDQLNDLVKFSTKVQTPLKKLDLIGDPNAVQHSLKKAWKIAFDALRDKGIEVTEKLLSSL